MSQQKVLMFITNDTLQVYRTLGRGLSHVARFGRDPNGLMEFDMFVAANSRFPYYALIDIVEEDFQLDSVPHVIGRDRKGLLARKQAQLFRGSRYTHAWVQGRDATGRRDDRVLFTGLMSSEVLDGWLDVLDRNHAPLAGVQSLPLLSRSLIKRISPEIQNVLLVTQLPDSGVRQSYFKDDELKFSRLTPLPEDDAGQLAARINTETARTRQYVASLRLIGRGDTMLVIVLCQRKHLSVLREECVSAEGIEYRFIDLAEVADLLGLGAQPTMGYGLTETLLAFGMSHRPNNHYAPPERRRAYHLWQLAQGLKRAALAVLLLGVGYAGVSGYLARQDTDEGAQLTPRLSRAELRIARNTIPSGKISPDQMLHLVQTIQSLQRAWPDMFARFVTVSQVLTQLPQLRLQQLEWTFNAHPAPADPAATASESSEADTLINPGDPMEHHEITVLSGRVTPFTDNYRYALQSVHALERGLVTATKGAVTLLTVPLDTKSSATIQSREEASVAAESEHVDFRVKLLNVSKGAAP